MRTNGEPLQAARVDPADETDAAGRVSGVAFESIGANVRHARVRRG
jgi:hypothetical protein